MKLDKLSIQHFKGMQSCTLDAGGKNVTVRGANGTGKTTIADGYFWLMTGKGADGKVIDTQIKARGADGSTPNDGGIEHTVEATFSDFDGTGREITLTRTFKEKWEKHRGQAESEFKGHTTTYSIDGIPMAKKEYERQVTSLVKGDTFSVLSMPLHFCTNTKWQDRRATLMLISGDVTDESIIDQNAELHPLKELLQGRSVEDFRKVLQSKLKKVNEETKTLPARIDELNKMIEDAEQGQPRETLENDINALLIEKQEKQRALVRLENGGAIAEQQKELAKVEAAMTRRQSVVEADYTRQANEARQTFNGCQAEVERLANEIERGRKELDRLETCISTADKLAGELRQEWGEVREEPFEEAIDDTCPYCGQPLPADKLEAITQAALESFNADKATRLKEITDKGKRLMAQEEADKQQALSLEEKENAKQNRIAELAAELDKAKKTIDGLNKPDVASDAEYKKLMAEKARIEAAIDDLRESTTDAATKLKVECNSLSLDITTRQEKLVAIKQQESTRARIEELKEQEAELGQTYSALQQQLFLTEEFMRAKVRTTEDNINSHFKYVKWQMFEQQVNGALKECCEPLIDGVPFSDGLNKGNKMKAALDIVQALSKYYGVTLPVFIDDCESYTSLPDIDTQVIKLIADGAHDALDIEIED